MSTSLSFNLFSNVLHGQQTNHRWISPLRSSMMELFVTMEVISYWQNSTSLNDVEIVELPIILSFQNKIR